MKEIIKFTFICTCSLVAVGSLLYFIFSFVLYDIDAANWPEGGRYLLGCIWILLLLLEVFVVGGYCIDNQHKTN